MIARVVLPVERHLGRVLACRLIEQVQLGAQVVLAAVVLEADAHRGGDVGHVDAAIVQALGPEVPGLVPAAGDGPILDERLPALAAVEGILDLIFDLGARRTTRADLGGGDDRPDGFLARRGQLQRDRAGAEGAVDDVGLRLG